MIVAFLQFFFFWGGANLANVNHPLPGFGEVAGSVSVVVRTSVRIVTVVDSAGSGLAELSVSKKLRTCLVTVWPDWDTIG
jgi:hypothetical protein